MRRAGPRPDDHTHAQMEPIEDDTGHTSKRVRCRHCHVYERVAAKLKEHRKHLLTCQPYLHWLQTEHNPGNLEQAQIAGPPQVGFTSEEQLQQLGAEALAASGPPFNLFDDPAVQRYLQALRPRHKPPKRKVLSGTPHAGITSKGPVQGQHPAASTSQPSQNQTTLDGFAEIQQAIQPLPNRLVQHDSLPTTLQSHSTHPSSPNRPTMSNANSSTPHRNPANSYVPKYTPPPEPQVLPAPRVENTVQIPGTMQVTTLTDIVSRIQESASILYPSTQRLRVTTAVAPSGLVCHALLLAPKNEESQTSRYKLVLKGPGLAGTRSDPATGRREALLGLLEEVEKKVGREILGGGV